MKSLITAVIPAYNEASSIAKCISALQSQETTYDFTITVINNASTDNTAEIAKKMGVKVINETKKGIVYARKAGLANTKTEFILFVDADSYLEKHWIKKAMQYIEKNPDCVAVASNFYFNDGNVFLRSILFLTMFMPAQLTLLFVRMFRRPEFIYGNAYMARTKDLKAVGASSDDFPFYGDDTALAYRLAKRGKIRYMQNAFVGTSARRFQKLGILKTLYRYGTVNTLITLGYYKEASVFSKNHH